MKIRRFNQINENLNLEIVDNLLETKESKELFDVIKNEVGYGKHEFYKLLDKYAGESNHKKSDLFNYWLYVQLREIDWDSEKSIYENIDDLYKTIRNLEDKTDDYFGDHDIKHTGDRGYQDLLQDIDDVQEEIDRLEKGRNQ